MSQNHSNPTNQEVFILRVWKSPEKNAPLRGQIQHVRSGRTLPIREPEIIFRFIQEQVENATGKSTLSGIR